MIFKGNPKRRSKFGKEPKPDWAKASKFVGVKMRPEMLHALDQLVAWAGGRRAGASRSSVIVGLINEAHRRGDPRTRKPEPPTEERDGPRVAATGGGRALPSPEDRKAAVDAALEAVRNAEGRKEKIRARAALEMVLAFFRHPDPPVGGKS